MTSSFPAGIEAYLRESGFSATEVLILRKFLEEEALTLREIAMKTGKSTGVLDQAMRRLMARGIIERTMHNDHPKYTLRSLEAIATWAKKDVESRRSTLDRKHESFAQFIGSLKLHHGRPDLQYFHGPEGVESAYVKLMETGAEFLTTTPILTTAEEDPLRECRVQIFRRRQVRKIFQRVIAPDTTLSRRYHSRDPFEYRKTLLVPGASQAPLEITIAGPLICCVDLQSLDTCLIRYPEYAESERQRFERDWECYKEKDHAPNQLSTFSHSTTSTSFLSKCRSVLLSSSTYYALGLYGIISVITAGFLLHNAQEASLQRIREVIVSIAAVGALQIQASDLEKLQTKEDAVKPEYAKVINILRSIREQNPHVVYVYIIRPTENPLQFMFVADADADPQNPDAIADTNSDGIIDDADQIGTIGLLYDVQGKDALVEKRYQTPIANRHPYTDQWGSFVTGYAPIFDEKGQIQGIIAVDMWAEKIGEFAAEAFSPILFALAIFFFIFLLRFWAINRSFGSEIRHSISALKLRMKRNHH